MPTKSQNKAALKSKPPLPMPNEPCWIAASREALADKWFMKPEEVAALQAKTASAGATSGSFGIGRGGLDPRAALFWCFVGIPIAWGVWITLKNAIVIFQ